jgi:hypothetical protein
VSGFDELKHGTYADSDDGVIVSKARHVRREAHVSFFREGSPD